LNRVDKDFITRCKIIPTYYRQQQVICSEVMKRANTPVKTSFEFPPPPIPAKAIRETLTADVVVVGAGIAGLTVALSAAESGARTILIEKGPTYNVRGLHNRHCQPTATTSRD
jgi:alkyl hydroperoxide reductase subunit AhpF